MIETTESIPPLILKHLHIESGVNRGRIYRVVPEGFKRPALPRLSKASTAELVTLLEHPNGWHRDTASRLLYQRQDADAVGPLRKLAVESRSPLGRLHALYALDGLNALDVKQVLSALSDAEPRVREHALKLAERFAERGRDSRAHASDGERCRCARSLSTGVLARFSRRRDRQPHAAPTGRQRWRQ